MDVQIALRIAKVLAVRLLASVRITAAMNDASLSRHQKNVYMELAENGYGIMTIGRLNSKVFTTDFYFYLIT